MQTPNFDDFNEESKERIRKAAAKLTRARRKHFRRGCSVKGFWNDTPWHCFIGPIHIGSFANRTAAVKQIRQNWNENVRANCSWMPKAQFKRWMKSWAATITYNPDGPCLK